MRRGWFTRKAKLSALLSSVLCTALIFFPLPSPKQPAHCKANGCRLTNSNQNPKLEAKPPRVLQKQQSILLRGRTAVVRGARAVLAGGSQDRFVSPPSFVPDSPSFMSPANPKCVLFSGLHSSQRQREELNPIPSGAARPQRRRIRHGGVNVPNKTITAGKCRESLFRWSPSKYQSTMTAHVLGCKKQAKKRIFALTSLPKMNSLHG